MADIQAEAGGKATLRVIAETLKARGIPPPPGAGPWSVAAADRLLRRLRAMAEAPAQTRRTRPSLPPAPRAATSAADKACYRLAVAELRLRLDAADPVARAALTRAQRDLGKVLARHRVLRRRTLAMLRRLRPEPVETQVEVKLEQWRPAYSQGRICP
ncbi:hypothetical protein E2C05_28870 [Paracraurococcus ruber]|uniref:hypothetical protein n=1 Tax=Paracraurococcus ruber TaxID=77675 RepID=UPI001057E96E|nr:hypothetical protein [Paracraurococcus ruber]TDG16842.1 hypothetical protein E2C05_28870 [Paracraurococcus ruber]